MGGGGDPAILDGGSRPTNPVPAVPTDYAAETGRMAEAFGLVAAVAVPVGGIGYWLAGRSLPPFRRPARGWTGADVLALFLLHFVLGSLAVVGLSGVGWFQRVYGPDFPPPDLQPSSVVPFGAVSGGAGGSVFAGRLADASAVRSLWGSLIAVPALLVVAAGVWTFGRGGGLSVTSTGLVRGVTAGVAGWLVFAPLVLGINFVASRVMESTGTTPEEHPFTRIVLTGRPGTTALFALAACVLAPLAEELLFRGLLIGWAVRGRTLPGIVLACWLFLAVVTGMNLNSLADGRVVFWLGSVGGLAVFAFRRPPARTAAAVYAAAAAFGMAHPVWPTPIPLFAFGLGLGWLFVRTGGLTAPVVAHGLFNAVSFVYLFRGGGGGV